MTREEEKAKAYDDALERAKKMLNSKRSVVIGRQAIETIFPELRESEDERIRKEIIDYLGLVGKGDGDYAQPMIDRWIAYLEKQKDSKWSPSRDEMGVLYKLCYLSNQITDEDDTKLTRLYQDLKREYFNGHSFENMFPSEKQKEQKHPNGCFTCDEYKKGYEEGRRNGFTAGYNKAMKEVEQKEQKSAAAREEVLH